MDVVNELPVDSTSKIDLDLEKKDIQDDSKLGSQESIEAPTIKHSFVRIDWIYLPLGAIIYLLSFFWRSNIGNTGFDVVTPDFKLTVRQSDAAWAAFFVLFVILPVMHTIIVERFVQARYWLTFLLLMLSAVQTGMGWADSKGWIYLCRILLGVCVSGIVPIMLCICMHWYSRFQTAFRFSCIVGPAILIGALSGILAWMLNIGIDQQLGQAGWRWILLIVGLLTFGITIASAFLLPQYPSKASWLSVEGREWHISHASADRQQLESEQSQSVMQVARSVLGKRQNQLYLLLCTLISFPLYGYYHYAGGVIARLASGQISLRWQFTIAAAPWALAVIVYMIASWYSDKLRQRGVFVVAGLLTISLGHILLISSKNVPSNIMGCFLVASGVLPAVHLALLWSCEEGGALARAIMCGLAYSCLQLAAFASRFMFAASHGPDFTAGHAVCLATSVAGATLAALLSRRERASRK